MGDLKTLEKARMELEELYSGIPDDSVNLTFQDLVIHVKHTNPSEKKTSVNMEHIREAKSPKQASAMIKLPSLDFNRGLEASRNHNQPQRFDQLFGRQPFDDDQPLKKHPLDAHRPYVVSGDHHPNIGRKSLSPSPSKSRFAMESRSNMAYDDVSVISMNSAYQEKGGRSRRPGIPHSNICTVCSTYIYVFRHRCLVCGRVYCKSCVAIGMGEMTEGRKCIQCLGRRFSPRYIQKAGEVGCCLGYPRIVKQSELKWAEKGPRRAGERAYGNGTHNSIMTSRSRSPMTPRTPRTPNKSPGGFSPDLPSFAGGSPYTPNHHSFVAAGSPFSPYTPNHHHLPL